MTPEIRIRKATPEDIPALVELRGRMLLELDNNDAVRMALLAERSVAWFAEAMDEGRATGFLAEKNGAVVGGLSVNVLETQPQYRSLEGRVGVIYGLFVEPETRGLGTATRLVECAVRYCRERGIEIVTLHAAEQARPIYERAGFSESNEMRLFLGEE